MKRIFEKIDSTLSILANLLAYALVLGLLLTATLWVVNEEREREKKIIKEAMTEMNGTR